MPDDEKALARYQMIAQSYTDGKGVLTIFTTTSHCYLRCRKLAENNETVKMRKFARDYLEKYPSVQKVYTAIAGNRRRGSVLTAEHYINYISFFVKYLGYEDPEDALVDLRSGKVDSQKD